eukprot:COSAG01_NODE_4230_length_5187_cov_2.551913_6_plen_69_part_00
MCTGWDVFVGAGHGMQLWMKLVLAGAVAIGTADREHSQYFEAGVRHAWMLAYCCSDADPPRCAACVCC